MKFYQYYDPKDNWHDSYLYLSKDRMGLSLNAKEVTLIEAIKNISNYLKQFNNDSLTIHIKIIQ